LNEKSWITPESRGLAPQEDGARPAGAEADAPTSTAASASTCASQATLMIRPSLPLRSDQVIE
jgi:hypothetical protein